MRKTYSPDYENGKCPLGFEYVDAYYDSINRRHVQSYCRKIKKFRIDPSEKEQVRSDKIHAKVDRDYNRALGNYLDSDSLTEESVG